MQDEQELPIDIHTNKLLDWLISRRHCKKEWSNSALIIREKINNAIQDMPAHEEITKLLSGTYINYFHCVKIVDILKETESESKNIFGRYSSQRMKDWQEVVSLYEKDNTYLAEAAHMLIQNIKYEIPAIKRQITKLQQVQQESEKKSVEYIKLAKELKDKYVTACKQMGVKGDNIRAEFSELLKDMPSAYESVVRANQKLEDAINYYSVFAEYVTGKSVKELLSLLNVLRTNGNITVYEWKYGKKPTSIEETKLNITDATAVDNSINNEIDFGDDAIDFGDSNTIDFGIEETIDFGDNLSDEVIILSVESETQSDGIARNEEALTILDSCSTRNSFINELFELESFLEQRVQEMQVEGDLLSMNQFQAAPATIQLQTMEKVQVMLSLTRNAINLLNDVKLKQLFIIKESPKYVDRIIETLNQHLIRAKKMNQFQEAIINKGKEAEKEEVALKPKLLLIIERTKDLHKMIEIEISKKYKNRQVNIMGSVNLLQQFAQL